MIERKYYEQIVEIRAFEHFIIKLFSENKLSGTTHTYIGEEATAVAVMANVKENDTVFSNHRCHGHYLAYGGPKEKLLAEIMSRKSGLCFGMGGSQHIHYKNFYSNGIQGGIVPNALGAAYVHKLDKSDANTIVFIGDGTLGQGVVYESFNMASVTGSPIMFVIEDNGYAMSTKSEYAVSGKIVDRLKAFNIKAFEIKSTNIDELLPFFEVAFDYLNSERKPVGVIVHNYRLYAHSKGDDIRDSKEVASHMSDDPVEHVRSVLGKAQVETLYNRYMNELKIEEQKLESEQIIKVESNMNQNFLLPPSNTTYFTESNRKCIEVLQETFKDIVSTNPRVIFLGEDIRDPYGGAFKATKGLSELAGERVLNTPISEACIVGMSVGMAMTGKIPICEMMFGDFIALGFDQLLNHAVKYNWVCGDSVHVPMVVRIPSGARRGYGPTHSQSMEKYMMGIPGLHVLALSPVHNPQTLYSNLVSTITSPTMVIENKKMYSSRIAVVRNGNMGIWTCFEQNQYGYSTVHMSLEKELQADYYAITYGDMVNEVIAAAEELMLKDEIQVDVIIMSQLLPVPINDLKEIIPDNAKIVTVEEGTETNGIGAELIAEFATRRIGSSYLRIAAKDCPIPNGIELEKQVIPDTTEIIRRLRNGK